MKPPKPPINDLDEFGLLEPSERVAAPANKTPSKPDLTPPLMPPDASPIADIDKILADASATALPLSAFQQAIARRLTQRAPVISQVKLTKKRRWPIAFGPTPVPPLTTITAVASPQAHFRGEKLINTGDTTGLFMSGLYVGQKPQLPTFSNGIKMNVFSPNNLDSEMLIDTAKPDEQIMMQVQNIGSTTATWSMTLIGHIID